MPISRRSLLCQFGAGAVMSAALPSLAESGFVEFPFSLAEVRSGGPIIFLGRNESPYGPSEKVIAAMSGAEHSANRYADAQTSVLRDRIAMLHGIKAEQIVLGCGSGEILNVAAATFAGPGKKVITALPTFEYLGRAAKIDGAEVIAVPLIKNFAHDLSAMLARTDGATGLVYICNPNNPTASITPRRDIEDFLQKLLCVVHRSAGKRRPCDRHAHVFESVWACGHPRRLRSGLAGNRAHSLSALPPGWH